MIKKFFVIFPVLWWKWMKLYILYYDNKEWSYKSYIIMKKNEVIYPILWWQRIKLYIYIKIRKNEFIYPIL